MIPSAIRSTLLIKAHDYAATDGARIAKGSQGPTGGGSDCFVIALIARDG